MHFLGTHSPLPKENTVMKENLRRCRSAGLVFWCSEAISSVLVYAEFFKKSFQRELQYRIANYSGFVVNVFFFLVRAYVFMALYENRDVVAGYDLTDAVTFTGLTQALAMVIGVFGRTAYQISSDVRSGQVATDLMKPINYQLFALSRQLGRSSYYLTMRALPIFAVLMVFFPWRLPQSVQATILFFLSLLMGVIITFSINFLTGLAAFWLLDTRGIRSIAGAGAMFLSGFIIPISFFPASFGRICEWLPFVGQSYTPVAIYLGKYTGDLMLAMIGRQIAWMLILIVSGKLLMSLAVRRIVIQGG